MTINLFCRPLTHEDVEKRKSYLRIFMRCVETGEVKDTPFVILRESVLTKQKFEIVGILEDWNLESKLVKEGDIDFSFHPFMAEFKELFSKQFEEGKVIFSPSLDKCSRCACCYKKVVKGANLCPCKQVRYCNEKCQLAHWKKHKPSCTHKKK